MNFPTLRSTLSSPLRLLAPSTLPFAALLTASILFTSPARAELINKVCILNGLQEVGPDTGSTGIGTGRFRINTDTNTMVYSIDISGVPETDAHIHGAAAPEVAGAIIHPLPLGDIKNGTWNYPQSLEAAILSGQTYVNIHSNAFPNGEIRGQIVDFAAHLDAPQENPAPVSSGVGYGLFNIDTSLNTLAYYIEFGGLSQAPSAAHFHGPADISVNATVMEPITDLTSPIQGTWNFDNAEEAAILASRTYVNIHTSNNPDGEIRGQVTKIVSTLHGAQEVPPNNVTGRGLAFYSLDQNTNMLGYYAKYTLQGTESNAHIHGFGPRTVPAGIKHGLAAGSPKKGVWNYAVTDETGIISGQTYMNIHSTPDHAPGEIRGQIEFRAPGPATAILWQLYD